MAAVSLVELTYSGCQFCNAKQHLTKLNFSLQYIAESNLAFLTVSSDSEQAD